jgi:tetratricopeptide (TPR) repeat protein
MKSSRYKLIYIFIVAFFSGYALCRADDANISSILRRDSSRDYVPRQGTAQRQANQYSLPSGDFAGELLQKADLEHSQMQDQENQKIGSLQKEIQERQTKINRVADYYNRGRLHYSRGQYGQAKTYFENILELYPEWGSAQTFLNSLIIIDGVYKSQARIENIKMKMLDIIAEYDKRVQRTESLAVKYFLEQAQQECQSGNFQAAEKYYDLCYKIYPFGKDKIEWFVKATHDLTLLYNEMEDENKRIGELRKSLK